MSNLPKIKIACKYLFRPPKCNCYIDKAKTDLEGSKPVKWDQKSQNEVNQKTDRTKYYN